MGILDHERRAYTHRSSFCHDCGYQDKSHAPAFHKADDESRPKIGTGVQSQRKLARQRILDQIHISSNSGCDFSSPQDIKKCHVLAEDSGEIFLSKSLSYIFPSYHESSGRDVYRNKLSNGDVYIIQGESCDQR